MVVKHLFEGGLTFMSVIYVLWIVVIFIVIRFLINYFSDKKDLQKLTNLNSTILFIGSLTFLIGLFGQMIGMSQALASVYEAGDISPALIAGGIRVTLIAPLYGFSLLLISGIIWFLFRNLLRK